MDSWTLTNDEQRVILDALQNSIDHAIFSDHDQIIALDLLKELRG